MLHEHRGRGREAEDYAGSMTTERVTASLVERVLGWRVGPDRFLLGNRQWIRRSGFEPFTNLKDAFQLLDKAASAFKLSGTPGRFTAEVSVENRSGSATGEHKAATITVAIARAVGLDAPDNLLQLAPTGVRPGAGLRRTR